MDLEEAFWSMVRNPELLRNYILSDGFELDDVCSRAGRLGLKCIPSASDEFKERLISVSITFLAVLAREAEELGDLDQASNIKPLLGDIASDLSIYGAPREVIDEAHELIRRIAGRLGLLH